MSRPSFNDEDLQPDERHSQDRQQDQNHSSLANRLPVLITDAACVRGRHLQPARSGSLSLSLIEEAKAAVVTRIELMAAAWVVSRSIMCPAVY